MRTITFEPFSLGKEKSSREKENIIVGSLAFAKKSNIISSLYPTTKVVGLLEDGIPDSLCFITRLKSCVFNESKIKFKMLNKE